MDEEAVIAMQEIRTLAGMFQQVLHNCKVRYYATRLEIRTKVK
jgi:hypothetical protein